MIHNQAKLYDGATNGRDIYKLDILRFFILEPVDEEFGPITITSGYRTPAHQELLRQRYGDRAAKNVSQHELAEASDFLIPNKKKMVEAFKWLHLSCVSGNI